MENQSEAYEKAADRVAQLKKYYRSVLVFLIVFGGIAIYRFFRTGDWEYSTRFGIVFLIFAIILAVKGVKLFLLNDDWERDMIKKELKKEENGNF